MRSRTDRGGHPILQNVRNRHRVMAAGAILLAATVAAGFFAVNAKADTVTDPDAGQVDRPIYYHNNNPSVGEIAVHVFGQKIDTDNEADLDNDADKQRAVVIAAKKRGALRIAVGVKLQRRIDGNWVTARSAAPVNSGTAASVKVLTSPASPFPVACGPYRYRAVANGGIRWANNDFQTFQVVSRTWFGEAPDCVS